MIKQIIQFEEYRIRNNIILLMQFQFISTTENFHLQY